jgi:Tat protein translocase TatB subunit
MFDIGFQELLVIGVLALLVFGPSKLPELGRVLGRALRELRRASEEFRSTIETNLHIDDPDPTPTRDVATALPASETQAPLAATAAAITADTWPPTEPFCAQSGARLFHRRECCWVGRIGENARVPLKSVADARAQGYLTCPVCEPREPD